MCSAQLWLFSQPKPLRAQLGDAFFQSVPSVPGVYLMTDRQERVIYVGQSGNLRRRLCSHKNIRPEKDPRRLVRLAQAAVRITWEPCDDVEEARLRENELLRLYRPKFNRVNTRPEAYGFLGFRAVADALELWLTQEIRDASQLYGAFKGLRIAGYGSLVRLLCLTLGQMTRPEAFPSGILGAKPRRYFRLPLGGGTESRATGPVIDSLGLYLDGRSDQLLDELRQLLPPSGSLPPFLESLRQKDLETLANFYERGPQRNCQFRQRFGIEGRLITPTELDDLPVLTAGDTELGC